MCAITFFYSFASKFSFPIKIWISKVSIHFEEFVFFHLTVLFITAQSICTMFIHFNCLHSFHVHSNYTNAILLPEHFCIFGVKIYKSTSKWDRIYASVSFLILNCSCSGNVYCISYANNLCSNFTLNMHLYCVCDIFMALRFYHVWAKIDKLFFFFFLPAPGNEHFANIFFIVVFDFL